AAQLVRRYLRRHRSGPECDHDRKSSDRPALEAVHERAGGSGGIAPTRLQQPSARPADRSLMQREDPTFGHWLDAQHRRAASAMLMSISAVSLEKRRPGFGQTVRPHRGSIVASPVLADWDPEPDYFFHWFRDSAVVIEALRLLLEAGHVGPEALGHFSDFVDFSLSLRSLDGGTLLAERSWRERCSPQFEKFLRSDSELGAVKGEKVVAEARVNPDATLDFSSW